MQVQKRALWVIRPLSWTSVSQLRVLILFLSQQTWGWLEKCLLHANTKITAFLARASRWWGWLKQTTMPNLSSILCSFARLPLTQFHPISIVSKKIWLASFSRHPWNPCQCFGRSCCLRPLKHLPERRKHCSPGWDNAAELGRRKPSGIRGTIHFSKGVNSRKQYSWENYTRFLPPEILPKNKSTRRPPLRSLGSLEKNS